MWDFDSLYGKALIYFTRAREHPRDDEVFGLWLLLGLEFLLRAPLARVHPALLAEPHGASILHAVGIPAAPEARPTSVQTKTVIDRLGHVVEAFTKERQDDATILVGLRNQELHTGAGALALDSSIWLPRFTRVIETICHHLGVDPAEAAGAGIMDQGRALVDAEDRRLEHEVGNRIEAARTFFNQLEASEITARRSRLPVRRLLEQVGAAATTDEQVAYTVRFAETVRDERTRFVNCPACDELIPVRLQPVRTTNERLEEDEIVRDVILVVQGLSCPICGLELQSTAEIRSAGLQQQHTLVERESLEDRFLSTYEPDYGND